MCTLMVASAYGAPDPDIYGKKWVTTNYQVILYSGQQIGPKIEKSGPGRSGWLGQKRYNALDARWKAFAEDAYKKAADDANVSLRRTSAYTQGRLTLDITPVRNSNNVADVRLSGVSLKSSAKFTKGAWLEARARGNLDNLAVQGRYDYYNGIISGASATGSPDVDLDSSISFLGLGILLDPIVNFAIDKFVFDTSEINSIHSLALGDNGMIEGAASIVSTLPDNKYVVKADGIILKEDLDVGKKLKEYLADTNIIGDRIQITVGKPTFKNKFFSVTIGKLTYKIWDGDKQVFCLLTEPECYPQ